MAPERTFIMVKPDGVERGLVSEVLKRFEQKGFKIVGMKMKKADKVLLEKHYEEHKGKPFLPKLIDYMLLGPVACFVFEGENVISVGRAILGATNPSTSAPGTIRGDFCQVMGRNLVHGSDGKEAADREIALWFGTEELMQYSRSMEKWIYE